MADVQFKPIDGLPESIRRDARVRYRRVDGYTQGAAAHFQWEIRLDRAATRDEKRWLKSRDATYFPGCWSIFDHTETVASD